MYNFSQLRTLSGAEVTEATAGLEVPKYCIEQKYFKIDKK
jgi:hypothetical protein